MVRNRMIFSTLTHCARCDQTAPCGIHPANDDFLAEPRKVNSYVANLTFLLKIVIALEFGVFSCQLLADLQKISKAVCTAGVLITIIYNDTNQILLEPSWYRSQG